MADYIFQMSCVSAQKLSFQFYTITLAKLIMTTMLEYFKMILKKVSFERSLFEKELRKAIARLIVAAVAFLDRWLSLR